LSDATVNADFSELAIEHTARADWQASPSPSVWRKRLDLAGPSETSRVTSVVRYDADSAFPSHPHPDGEEILVLDGVFSDEHGDYPKGAYLLNPEGFSHAPFSREGCILFVKLRQYPGLERQKLALDTTKAVWQETGTPGLSIVPLYREDGYPETMQLVRMVPGTAIAPHDHGAGAEIFVLDGSFRDVHGTFETGSWVRYPPGSSHAQSSEEGCIYYLKTGHLSGV